MLTIAVAFICMFAIHIFMKVSNTGKAMRAAAMDPVAARSCGINVDKQPG